MKIRKLTFIAVIIIFSFTPISSQKGQQATLYLKNGVTMKVLILETGDNFFILEALKVHGENITAKIPLNLIYKLVNPSGESIFENPEYAIEFNINREKVSKLESKTKLSTKVITVRPPEEELSNTSEGWLNVGIGGGTVGISIGGDFSFRVTDRLISQVSLVHSESFEIFADTPEESVTSLALLTGVKTKDEHSMAAILIGVSYVGGFHRGSKIGCSGSGGFFCNGIYEKISFKTMGILGNIQFYWKPSSSFGIGINSTGNINSETSFVVALLSLQFGS